jgi:hypothetical protein
VRIYLAEGLHRTLVGRRPPTVRGRCDSRRLGSVTVIRPRPVPGVRPAGFAIPRVAGWTFLGRPRDDYRMINPDTDRDATRLAHLSRLADETESFVRRQRALAEARETLRSADYLLDTGDPALVPADFAADLADHTSSVLEAYQELTS